MTVSCFSIEGFQPRSQPNLSKSKYEPGQLEYATLDGSFVYIGTPTYMLHWDLMILEDVRQMWFYYESQLTSGAGTNGLSISLPSIDGLGYQTVQALFTLPTGNVAGDYVENFEITVYNVYMDDLDFVF